MFIEEGSSFHPSSFRSETYIALPKELNITEEDCCYKHRAPNGAQQGKIFALRVQWVGCRLPTSMMLQLDKVHQHLAPAFDYGLLLS